MANWNACGAAVRSRRAFRSLARSKRKPKCPAALAADFARWPDAGSAQANAVDSVTNESINKPYTTLLLRYSCSCCSLMRVVNYLQLKKNMVCAPPEHKKKYGGPYFFQPPEHKTCSFFFWADLIFFKGWQKKQIIKNRCFMIRFRKSDFFMFPDAQGLLR
jgi:hypothetical protein